MACNTHFKSPQTTRLHNYNLDISSICFYDYDSIDFYPLYVSTQSNAGAALTGGASVRHVASDFVCEEVFALCETICDFVT